MKLLSSTAIGTMLGYLVASKKDHIVGSCSIPSNFETLILKDNSVAAGIFQTNSNILATSIWFINTLSLAWDVLSVDESDTKITFVNEKGKKVKKLECNKTEKVDLISKAIQVFTPIGYCLYEKFLKNTTHDECASPIDLQKVINYSIYGTIGALAFNIIGSEFISEKITCEVPKDLSLYLEHTTSDGHIQIQNIIEYAEITI
jgi:hypothetical protein